MNERYATVIAQTLASWRAALMSKGSAAIGNLLARGCKGMSFIPTGKRQVGSHAGLQTFVNSFDETLLARDKFLASVTSRFALFMELFTVDFQIVEIARAAESAPMFQTKIRYAVVGRGKEFHREQRVGHWQIEWRELSDGTFVAEQWRTLNESVSRATSPVFVDISAHALGANASYQSQLMMGVDHWRTVLDGACGIDIYGHNGISVGDMDGDGLDDLYVCQPAGLPNRLYRNRGDGTFEDITAETGVGLLDNASCALFADFRNSGQQDLLVVRENGPLLFLNEGNGKLRPNPDAFHFGNNPQGTFTGAAVADYNRDGLLDVYFCLYLYYQGAEQYKYPVPYYDAENGPPNFLMRNRGDGTFVDVTAEAGLSRNNNRYSFCCAWADLDGNGWPDLYVVNDFGRKNLYRNNGDGTFTDVAEAADVSDVGAGMSVACADYNNDGLPDLYVANMWTSAGLRVSADPLFQKRLSPATRALYRKHAMGNSLFRNSHGGNFSDESTASATQMGGWSWASDFWDFDHDGHQDLYVTNGMVSGPSSEDLNSFFWRQVVAKSPDAGQRSVEYEQGWNAVNELLRADGTWSGYERNVAYVNNGDGTFADVSGALGLDLVEDGRAFALSDIDGDGRLELLLKNRNAPQIRILKNVIGDLPPSISFRLSGTQSNRDAIGAAVTLYTSNGTQTRTVQCGSGFLSQHTKELVFGLGSARGPFRADVRWPNGRVQRFANLPAQHRILVTEGKETLVAQRFSAFTAPKPEAMNIPEQMPADFGTWLLSPMLAPQFRLSDDRGQDHSLSAMLGTPVLLVFSTAQTDQARALADIQTRVMSSGLQIVCIRADKDLSDTVQRPWATLSPTDEMLAIYDIAYRYLFDRHRDMPLPYSLLIDAQGKIAKVFQGSLNALTVIGDLQHMPADDSARMKDGLPFPGVVTEQQFRRNYLSYGSMFFQHGYFEQAEQAFREALAQHSDSAEACYGMGSAQLKLNRREQAVESFRRATELHASYPDTLANSWNNLGLIAAEQGNTNDAVTFFRKALDEQPTYVIAWVNLGNAYRQQKDWNEAQDAFVRALDREADDPEANYGLGMVYAQNGNTEEGLEYLERALQVRPDYPEALNNLGVLYLRTGKEEEAIKSFRRCIQVAPKFDQSYLNLARVLAIENRIAEAKQVLGNLLQQYPSHPQAEQQLQELNGRPH